MSLPRHVFGGQITTLCWFLPPPSLRQDVLWFPTSCARLASPRTSGNPPASHLSVTALRIQVHMATPGCPRVLWI